MILEETFFFGGGGSIIRIKKTVLIISYPPNFNFLRIIYFIKLNAHLELMYKIALTFKPQ